jgi:putative transcriptional regulator
MENLLRVERARHKISQEVLAREVNVARQSIQAIESGKFSPSVVLALRIANFFKVDVEYLFILDEEEYSVAHKYPPYETRTAFVNKYK